MKYESLTKEITTLIEMMNITIRDISVVRDSELDMLICSFSVKHIDSEIFFENEEQVFRDFGLLVRLFVQKKLGLKANILFDVNHRQLDFIEQAKEKARIASERVLFFNREYEFGYLSAYERMIIHSYLKKQPDIETISQGEGHDRRLIVKKQES